MFPIDSVKSMTPFDRVCMSDCTCCVEIGRVIESTGVSWIALGIMRGACNWIKERCGPGRFEFEREFKLNEASRDPCHRDHTGCATDPDGAPCQSVAWCDSGSQDRGSCDAGSGSRGGDRRDPWRSRAG